MPFSIERLLVAFRADPIAFFERFGWTGLHGILGWLTLAPLVGGALYLGLVPVVRYAARRLGPRRRPPHERAHPLPPGPWPRRFDDGLRLPVRPADPQLLHRGHRLVGRLHAPRPALRRARGGSRGAPGSDRRHGDASGASASRGTSTAASPPCIRRKKGATAASPGVGGQPPNPLLPVLPGPGPPRRASLRPLPARAAPTDARPSVPSRWRDRSLHHRPRGRGRGRPPAGGVQGGPGTRGRTCRAGLWRYSRHPNYFFEWLHLVSATAVFALGVARGLALDLLPGAHALLPVPRDRHPHHRGRRPCASRGDDYRDYQRTTSAFVPWFRRGAHERPRSPCSTRGLLPDTGVRRRHPSPAAPAAPGRGPRGRRGTARTPRGPRRRASRRARSRSRHAAANAQHYEVPAAFFRRVPRAAG